MSQQQWARVVDGVMLVAPGAKPPGADPAEWLPVVDTNDPPPLTHTASETYLIHPDRVVRTWVNPVERPEFANARTVATLLRDVLPDLRDYAALAAPTNAQTVAVVKRLCRAVNALVRDRVADFTEAP